MIKGETFIDVQLEGKWTTILFLAVAELLAMGTWFSASATSNALGNAWDLSNAGQAWLTMAVQLGFVIGSLVSAIFNIPDRTSSKKLFVATSLLSALCTALIPLVVNSLMPALVLRFLTGFFLVGVYPVGMKIMATWTKKDRGFGIGLLVGALTIGTAFPHLLSFLTVTENWKPVLYAAALFGALGGLVAALFVREGPFISPSPKFNWRYIGEIFKRKELRLANFGYLGHMWELFAMWAWVAVFFQESLEMSGDSQNLGSMRFLFFDCWVLFWEIANLNCWHLFNLGLRGGGRFSSVQCCNQRAVR
ncbi:MAG: MFS transporter [Anaerolineales bacterium]